MGAFKDQILKLILDGLADLQSGQRGIDRRLDRIEGALANQTKEIKAMSIAEKQAIADLTASIAAEKTVIDGVSTLVDGAVAQLKDLGAQLATAIQDLADQGANVTALTALKAQVDENAAALSGDKDKLAAAVVTGTPAAPPADAPPGA